MSLFGCCLSCLRCCKCMEIIHMHACSCKTSYTTCTCRAGACTQHPIRQCRVLMHDINTVTQPALPRRNTCAYILLCGSASQSSIDERDGCSCQAQTMFRRNCSSSFGSWHLAFRALTGSPTPTSNLTTACTPPYGRSRAWTRMWRHKM